LINSVVSFLPEAMTEDLQTTNILVALAIILITAIIIARGYVNASTIKVNALSVTFYRNEHLGKELTITVLSDLHLGTNMGKDKVEEMVQTVNSLQPDLVLIAGDIIDENIEPLLHDNLTQPLKKITAPMGVYAVPGNHEHLGGIQMVSRVLAQSGITLLRDSVVKAGDWVTVAGRDDIAAAEMTGKKRKDLPTLLSGIDTTLPLIVMDHRPLELDEIEAQGVDLFVAGHTHAGQLWPFGLFIRRSYELLTGILRRHSANYYVTSGVGTWGPPIRIGSKSEIVNLVVEFKAQVDPNLLHGGKQGGTRGSLDLS
jgi:predicted MPP superfamily phosphohydrolase